MIVTRRKVVTPASSANLGPGFDVLAVAIAKYLTIEIEPSESLEVVASGFGSELKVDDEHLAVKVLKRVLGHTRVKISIDSGIPLARGMGSSAALAIAVAVACGSSDPLAVALSFEGHPENAAASLKGGALAAIATSSGTVISDVPIDPDLVAVLVVPELELSTRAARQALPVSVPFADAIGNIGRAVTLALCLSDIDRLRPEMFLDVLHQPYRAAIFPDAPSVLAGLLESGCVGAAWSGAGSSMIGFARRSESARILQKVKVMLLDRNLGFASEVVEFDRRGTHLLEL